LNLLDLKKQRVSVREAARVADCSPKTVHRWSCRMESSNGPLGEGTSNSARLQREIAVPRLAGKMIILKGFLKPFRPAVPPKATMRYETAPGEQAQADFGTRRDTDGSTPHLDKTAGPAVMPGLCRHAREDGLRAPHEAEDPALWATELVVP
jgi:hypothetical protein